jgi:hypothetical protein
MPIIPIGSSKSEYGNGTNATIKTLLLQNVIVHPFPVQLIYCIFITLQTKGKTLQGNFKLTQHENTDKKTILSTVNSFAYSKHHIMDCI